MRTTIQTIHVFTAFFENEDAALAYTQPQWEPKPAEGAGDEEYEAWEDRNPSCLMKEDLGFDGFLDDDFVETIWRARYSGNDVDWNYLSGLIGSANANACKNMASDHSNTLILIDAQALDGRSANLRSTTAMTYCGTFSLERVWFGG